MISIYLRGFLHIALEANFKFLNANLRFFLLHMKDHALFALNLNFQSFTSKNKRATKETNLRVRQHIEESIFAIVPNGAKRTEWNEHLISCESKLVSCLIDWETVATTIIGKYSIF